jgi:hypothetical protein
MKRWLADAGRVGLLLAISVGYFALCASITDEAQAAAGQPVIDGYLEPNGYTQITSLSSAVGLGTIPNGTRLVIIQAETNDVRWRDDGVNPTTSVGMVLAAGQILSYNGNAAALKVIEVTASAKLNVTYYK